MTARKPKTVFMCGVQFQHEIGRGNGIGPRVVYNSLAELKRHEKCWDECGVVEVHVELKRWAAKQDIMKAVRRAKKEAK